MSEMFQVDLTAKDRKTLLRGLRYVRSSIMLEVRDRPTAEDEDSRRDELRQVQEIVDRLNEAPSVSAAEV